MRRVLHLVAIPEPDERRKVVLDDAEVVAVVRDVRREQQRVTSTEDALLAQVGREPIDFVHQLVRLHDLGRLGEPLADLGEEGDVSVRDGLVVLEAGVGQLLGAPRSRALDESTGARIVPRLGARDLGRDGHHPQTAGGTGRSEQAMHPMNFASVTTLDKHVSAHS